ncbi:hypothetical protein CVT25_013172 [Psilocybe cyanescens]|uniref:Carbohydrate esterase family 16 protein n=1 Tax=Psilocybe cyanescens TaxID=93625 RepID=A0A409XCM9_PSICY|nr:hypothetical protein CVT25_013172 [Psilocybe cyanescens]
MSRVSISLTFLVGVLPYVLAQSPLYGQWYSQCIPGSATTSSTTVPITVPSPTSTSKTSTAPTSTPTSASKANYWFNFGDSYSQTGFNITGPLPNSANPIGNPDFPGWSATGGANWVGYVTGTYNNSLLYTYNYAYGGATIDANLVTPYEPTVLSLTDQVNQFLTTVASKPATTPWTSSNALFSVWIGVNDIGNSYYNSGDRSAFSDTLLSAYFALVQKLYNAGGRNFLFANVPPIDRSPLMLAQSADAQALEKSVIGTFNTKLAAKISAFAAANTGTKTFLWDSNAQFTTILNAPTSYGFQDATSFGSAANMFWGNNYHPSTYANKFFGQTVGQTVLAKTIW